MQIIEMPTLSLSQIDDLRALMHELDPMHVQALYEELLADVPGLQMHKQPADPRYDANFWLCAATIDRRCG